MLSVAVVGVEEKDPSMRGLAVAVVRVEEEDPSMSAPGAPVAGSPQPPTLWLAKASRSRKRTPAAQRHRSTLEVPRVITPVFLGRFVCSRIFGN